jgi:phage baseplate assembly protein W
MTIELLTGRTKKISIYSDFKKDMEKSPVSSDLTVRKDEESVKEAIKNILLTDRGERLMQPNLGGHLKAMLFENITPGVLKTIEDQVRTTLDIYEPRAELLDVTVSSLVDDNTVRVRVEFMIRNQSNPISVDVFLERTR